jgi:hypothetical protein
VVIVMYHVLLRRPAALAVLLLSLLVLGSATAASALQPSSGRRANARKLLRIADGASQRLIQAGQGRLDRNARSRPFWDALLQMDAQIDRIGAGLRTRDLSFFQALRSGTATLAELQVTWALAGVKDPMIDQNLRMLSAAYGRLRNRYGPEWVRFQAGRPLSEDERLRFARMRAGQGLLADKVEPLRDRAARAGDYATVDELTLLLAQIHAIATASPTLGDYLDASVAADSIRGAWFGTRAAHAADEQGWSEADQVVSDITTDEDVGFVFTSDLKTVQDWSYLEEETEIPAEIAQAEAEEKGEKGEISPGQVVELGTVEEGDLTDRTDDPTDPADPTDPSDAETTFEEPAAATTDEAEEPVEELSAEPLPGDETIEEEDLAVEPPAAGEAPAGSPPPPPAAPQSLPIG